MLFEKRKIDGQTAIKESSIEVNEPTKIKHQEKPAEENENQNIELTKEQKESIEYYELFQRYYGSMYGAQDVAVIPQSAIKAESLNLQFAIFCELAYLTEVFDKMADSLSEMNSTYKETRAKK